eukprot:5362196-Pyramimonas_sp.AAC.1
MRQHDRRTSKQCATHDLVIVGQDLVDVVVLATGTLHLSAGSSPPWRLLTATATATRQQTSSRPPSPPSSP